MLNISLQILPTQKIIISQYIIAQFMQKFWRKRTFLLSERGIAGHLS